MKKKLDVYADILHEVPWYCGEKDCESVWHKATYWFECRGKKCTYTYDGYSDGDHEPVYKRDIPSDKEINQAWSSYYSWVAENGKDPLGSFLVHPEKKIKEKWEFVFSPWIGKSKFGLVMTMARKKTNKRREWLGAENLPKEVVDFLGIKKNGNRYTNEDFKSIPEIKEKGVNVNWKKKSGITAEGWAEIERTVPNKSYRKTLIRLAKSALKEESK